MRLQSTLLIGTEPLYLPRLRKVAEAAVQPVAHWDAAALRLLLAANFRDDQLIVVSNREPYVHERADGVLRVTQPAGGLVTALDPLLRASGGTWIAHGSGNADRETVDARDGLRAPPAAWGWRSGGAQVETGADAADAADAADVTDAACAVGGSYRLRRVWLTPREVHGYCDGFANSGLWPLCHTARVQPVFEVADWARYCAINQRFADAVVAEARRDDPIVLVQDYHLALVPALVRRQLPQATIASFWHIPWGPPHRMARCPWLAEILDGLLGSDVVGLQTPQHRNHFIDCVNATLGGACLDDSGAAGANWRPHPHPHPHPQLRTYPNVEQVQHVQWRGRRTLVNDCPISIAWPAPRPAPSATVVSVVTRVSARARVNAPAPAPVKPGPSARSTPPSPPSPPSALAALHVDVCRRAAFARWGLAGDGKLVIGVDRFDYTKGLLERVRAIEHLLLTQPHWQTRLRFVQVAAPTRSSLPHYARFRAQVVAEVTRINARFAPIGTAPIVLIEQAQDRTAVDALYRAADVCLVLSLHDGMNLVSKEFVAARDDGHGVLVLSQFAGAAHELTDALIVNPYDAAEVARAIDLGLSMPIAEQRRRMAALRHTVRNANVHRWAARVLLDADRTRAARDAWSTGVARHAQRA